MIWNIIAHCLCGAVIAELAWQLRKRKKRIDEMERDIQTYDEILNDTRTENGRLREELEQAQKQLAKFKGCPELGIAYKLQDVGTKIIEVKRYIGEYDMQDCRVDIMRTTKDAALREVWKAAKEMCKVIVRPKSEGIEVCCRLVVGMVEEDR